MTAEQHERAARAFAEVCDKDPAEWSVRLTALLGDDPAACALAHSLLAADARNARGFLEAPARGADLARAPEAAFRAPAEAGPYRLGEVLGEGEHAVVFLGEQDEPVRRRAAVKVLRSASGRAEVLRRFDLERRAIALMDHPHIARLYDAGRTPDGRAYFAMEYVPGEPVTAFAARRRLPVAARLHLFLQACRAIEHAHQRGIIHRDLKPSNILARSEEPAPVVKVIDFGVAKAIQDEQGVEGTQEGQIVGTLAYMSPEQIRGGVWRVDTRADVYGLGAVLYELLTERAALDLEGMSPAQAIGAIAEGRGARAHGLRGDLATIVGKAMDPEPARRYESAADLRRDVERYLGRRPILARRPGPIYVARKFVARRRALSAALATGLVLAGVSGWWIADTETELRHEYGRSVDLADALLEDVSTTLASGLGNRRLRRELLESILPRLLARSRQGAHDPALLAAQARLLMGLGDLDLEEGLTARARARFEEALALRERVERLRGDDPSALDVTIAMVRLGDAHKEAGDLKPMMAIYREVLARHEALAARHPDDRTYLEPLAWSCDRVGVHEAMAGRHAPAAQMFDRQLELLSRLCSEHPGDADLLRGMASVCIHLADLPPEPEETEIDRRLIWGSAALGHARAAVEAAPGDRFAQDVLCSVLLHMCDTGLRAGDARGVAASAAEAARIAGRLHLEDPQDAHAIQQWRGALAFGEKVARATGDAALATTITELEESMRRATVSRGLRLR